MVLKKADFADVQTRYQIVRMLLNNSDLLKSKLSEYEGGQYHKYYMILSEMKEQNDLQELMALSSSEIPTKVRSKLSKLDPTLSDSEVRIAREKLIKIEKDHLLKMGRALQGRQRSCC